ncbi:FIMAH domain-containing protein [Marinicrinis lubricantis]|uniref:FIMAH domain-containing protein n=1 Tax=Marinicrinis lubricantis TaxID=2086470 RepID=A0ABW1IPC7_9BACL
MKKILPLFLMIVLCFSVFPPNTSTVSAAYNELPAFPGAEGFGYAAKGGRGGEVYHVTSYELTGPGTFHDALMTAGDTPRTIVFDISGEITIPRIVVRNKSNITIAGQTAPGDGVTIKGHNIRFIDCNDIVIRYMRFRIGMHDFKDDTMYFENCQNVIIDHSTFSWGTDEVLSILSKDYENPKSKNITVQWSIISEGLLTHSMGGLIEMNTITMHHNLYAHNNDRNPKTKGQIDFVNNIVYNWGDYPYVAGGESGTKGYGNVVGNYFIAGKNSKNPEYAVVRGNENYSLYLHNNRIDSNKNGVLDGTDTGAGMMEEARPSVLVPERFAYPPVHTQEPEVAYEYVLEHAGASLVRDLIDERTMDGVKYQYGVIIGDENDMGGYAPLKQATAPADTDRDGMPDAWEEANGLDPNDPSDRNGDRNGDGYTNLEDYLNELAAPGFPEEYPMEPIPWSGPVFTPPQPEPQPEPNEPEPGLDIIAPMYGDIIRSAVVNDNSSSGLDNAKDWSIQQNLQPGDLVAGDRQYQFVSIQEHVKGLEYVRSAVDSRSATNDDVLSFYLAADADVYVALDTRVSPASWLTSAYEDTGEYIEDTQPVQFQLYKRHYDAGSYVVTGKNNNSKRMNYFVIVKQTNSQEAPPAERPSGLAANLSDGGSVTLDWAPVSGAETYFVYRSSSNDPSQRIIASTAVPMLVDSNTELGVTYEYHVSAVNGGGESLPSDPAEVFNYDPNVPAPATPQGLHIPVTRSMSVVLEWTPVEQAVSYSVYRAEGTDSGYVKIGSTAGAEYTDSNVKPSTTYYYKVQSMGIGGVSEWSAPVSTTTKPPVTMPQAPTGLTEVSSAHSSFEIKWDPVGNAESYNIYRKANEESTYSLLGSTSSASYVDGSVSVSRSGYSYKVTAVNEMGESAQSDDITITMPLPTAPIDFEAGWVGDTFVGFIWTSGSGESQVNVYREANGVVEYVGYGKVNTFYDRTAQPGVEYTYYAKGVNASGESEMSNTVTVTPGYVTVLENWMEIFQTSNDLSGPLVHQLSNTLRQAQHHLDKGSVQKAVQFAEKYLEQLGEDAHQEHVSALAKWMLSKYAEEFITFLQANE